MTVSNENEELAARIVKRLLSKGVVGTHHKQPQSVAKWFAVHKRGDVKQTIDEMVSDPSVPLYEKGRGTVHLSSVEKGQDYLESHGYEPPSKW